MVGLVLSRVGFHLVRERGEREERGEIRDKGRDKKRGGKREKRG